MCNKNNFNEIYPGVITGLETYSSIVDNLDLSNIQKLFELTQKIEEQWAPIRQIQAVIDASISPSLSMFAKQIDLNAQITKSIKPMIDNHIDISIIQNSLLLNNRLEKITASINRVSIFDSLIESTQVLSKITQNKQEQVDIRNDDAEQ